MARKTKKAKKPKYAAVVGLVGSGKVTVKAAKSHLSDFIERFSEDGEILWVLPDTDDVTKSLTAVKNFLWEEEATYVLVSDGTFGDDDWIENAKSTIEVEPADVYASLVTEVSGYEAGNLSVIFILDEEHDGDVELLEAASSEGLTCYDLTAGLNELELADVEEEEEAEEDEDAEEVEAAEEEEAEEADAPAIPEKIQALIDKGKIEQAAAKLTESMDRDDLAELSDELGVGAKTKGVWAKTIAKNIVEFLAPEPEAEEEPEEEAPKPAAKKKTRKSKATAKKAKEPEPEVEDEPEEDVVAVIEDEVTEKAEGVAVTATTSELDHLRLRAEVISASSYVAGQKGADEAGKYIAVLKKAGLLV